MDIGGKSLMDRGVLHADLAIAVPVAKAERGFAMRDLMPAAVLLFVGMFGLVAATLAPTGKDGQYAVIAPPWYDLRRTIALIQTAGGGVADIGGPTNIVIAHSEKPDFVRALYGAGAWLVIDPMRLRGCVGFKSAPDQGQGA
jgi:hypothetical protein